MNEELTSVVDLNYMIWHRFGSNSLLQSYSLTFSFQQVMWQQI